MPSLWFLCLGSLLFLSSVSPAGTVTGRLVQNGSPVSDAYFSIRYLDLPIGSSQVMNATVNADGTFSVELEEGIYEVGTSFSATLNSAPGFENIKIIQHVPAFPLASGQNRHLGDLEVLGNLHKVSGTILEVGQPSHFANISAAAEINGLAYRVWSLTYAPWVGNGSEGSFSIYLASAEWTVGAENFAGFSGQQTVIVADAEVSDVVIEMQDNSPYAVWAGSYGLAGEDANYYADPDLDDYDNAAEFAFGTHPLEPTAALSSSFTHGGQFTLSWLERADASFGYFVRGSDNLASWRGAAVEVVDGAPGALDPPGYARRQFTVPATGRRFYRVSAAAEPAAVPDESFTISVSGELVSVERWGSGPKAIVFFGYIPFFLQENLKANSAGEFAALLGEEYSMFLWTYPDWASPFSEAYERYGLYTADPGAAWTAQKIDFTGVTSSVVSQIRAATGLQDVCIVANSFGAGVVMWDFAALSADPSVRFVLISPTELYLPAIQALPSANPLPRTSLLADAAGDEFFDPAVGAVRDYVSERANVDPLPGAGHFIIGEDPVDLEYVFSLVDALYARQP